MRQILTHDGSPRVGGAAGGSLLARSVAPRPWLLDCIAPPSSHGDLHVSVGSALTWMALIISVAIVLVAVVVLVDRAAQPRA